MVKLVPPANGSGVIIAFGVPLFVNILNSPALDPPCNPTARAPDHGLLHIMWVADVLAFPAELISALAKDTVLFVIT